jgi:ubiquinol-cytochrome c reductase cytochrome b subunit
MPDQLGHPDNYIRANALVTPTHIVPEWYLLTFYAILRSIPSKLGGVLCMGAAIAVLLILPIVGQFKIKSSKFNKVHQFFFLTFYIQCDIITLLRCSISWRTLYYN